MTTRKCAYSKEQIAKYDKPAETLTSKNDLVAELEAAAAKWVLEKNKYTLESLRDARAAVLKRLTPETFVQPSTKSAKNACFQAELQTDQRLNESTTNERPCHGCEHQIPWDWVFCAWCGFENDSPALKANEPPAVELWYCPNCKSGNRVDFHHTSCPACGRLRAEKNGLSAPSEGK